MATKNLKCPCTINEGGNAQNPAAGVEMQLHNPDGTIHTAWGAATQDTNAGTGAYYRDFTISDEGQEGVFSVFFKTETDGGKFPIGAYPVMVTI